MINHKTLCIYRQTQQFRCVNYQRRNRGVSQRSNLGDSYPLLGLPEPLSLGKVIPIYWGRWLD